jgi:triosephosphate isomerase
MARTPFMAGNWKLNKTVGEAVETVKDLVSRVSGVKGVDIAVAPVFTGIHASAQAAKGSNVAIASQDIYWEENGAFTGEVSGSFLKDAGAAYAIIAHSERRQYFGETNETANKRIKAAQANGLGAIYCVGETLAEREGGKTLEVIGTQIKEGLVGFSNEAMSKITIAYEPVWAIGTGKVATPEEAQNVHAAIRKQVADLFDQATADAVRIQYGGSVKPGNVKELMSQPDIDGALVGGASLKAEDFEAIVKFQG